MVTKEVITVEPFQFVIYEKSTLVTVDVLKKLGPRVSEVSLVQRTNIPDISVTAEVSKLDKSREESFVQLENILCISVTAEVSKLDKLREERLEQLENIEVMFVTAEVLNPVRLREVMFVHK